MQTGAGVPFEIVNVSIALIIFFVGINFLIRFVMAKVFQGKTRRDRCDNRIETNESNHEGANYNVDYRINCLDPYFYTGLFNTANSNVTRRNFLNEAGS